MNRLVIIGNGFDLAHGLPTSYGHFINDFWKNFKDKCKSEEYQKLILTNDAYDGYYLGYKSIENFNDLKSNLSEYCQEYSYQFNKVDLYVLTKTENKVFKIFQFKNYFFKIINDKNSNNWVDIENEYYSELKKIVKSSSLSIEERKEKAIILNQEFEQIKTLLEKYLKEKVINKYNFDDYNDQRGDFFQFYDLLYPEILVEEKIEDWKEEFSKSDKIYINKLIKEEKQKEIKLHLLCFNYTPTVHRYLNQFKYYTKINTEVNFIHGQVGNYIDNKINFGFGDEMDDDYKIIENIDDNEYLTNFKSFQYLQNTNYKRLLDFIESERFEVFIMGSSCGLSDRTLLNSIFENDNCRLIKVFYYKNGESDNFTELTQNISRHFNKKSLMRSKIVHKSNNQIMPKIQLPLK